MKRYHINPETGEPGVCTAKVKCRFGGEGDHYPSDKDARQAFERRMMRETWRQAAVLTVEPLAPELIPAHEEIHLPAGEYFIGDPYLTIGLDQDGWNRWVDMVDKTMGWENDVDEPEDEKQIAVGATVAGEPVTALKSYYGDGLHWSVAPPRRLPSDVGLMGAVPTAVLFKMGLDPEQAQKQRLGVVHTFDQTTIVYRETNGNVFFGEELMVVHNATVSDEAFRVLDEGDTAESSYGLESRRARTYHSLVNGFIAKTVD